MSLSMKKALILDLDNTLYNWIDAFAESFRKQVFFLSQSLGVEKKVILRDFKSVFKRYNSVEVPNAVYQLPTWSTCKLNEKESKYIQDTSLNLLLRSWEKNIKLFPKVEETLNWARELDFLIFAYSDAFAFWIDFRLSTLNIQKYFDNIFAMTDGSISDSDLVINSRRKCQITSVKPSEMKPNTLILDQILTKYKIKKEHAYFVGDSITKDIYTARQAGVCDIWAKYGLNYNRENGHLLSYVTPWEKGVGGINELNEKTIPTYTIQRFDEIKSIIASLEG